jgi:hypothetical protein
MSFFAEHREEPAQPEIPETPAWMAPPRLRFSGMMPMNQVLAEGARGAVVLTLIRAFDVGCALEISSLLASPGTYSERMALMQGVFGYHHAQSGGELPASLLRFGVEYPDGRTATTLTTHPSTLTEGPAPQPPTLAQSAGMGREGGESEWMDITQQLWLWTLPPAETFNLLLEWPAAGIPETRIPLDGAAINEAAGESRPFIDR